MAVLVRDADPERDAAACAAIYGPYVSGTTISFEEEPPDAAEMAARIRRHAATHAWLVAEDDGAVVGYAYAAPFHARAAYRWAAEVAVYVDPTRHRGGVGRLLYTELVGRLRARGLRMACATITLPNPPSVALHEALGFRRAGVLRSVGWKAGAWRDVSLWQLALGDTDAPPEGEPGR